MQKRRPIAYSSHTLSASDWGKPVYESELMALVMAVLRWRPYLLGQKFVVRVDQKALEYLLEQKVIHHSIKGGYQNYWDMILRLFIIREWRIK